MEVVKATEDDLIVIMYFVKTITEEMNLRGEFNWSSSYPGINDVKTDIEKELIYLLKSRETAIGLLMFRNTIPPEFTHLGINPKTLMIHRLYVHSLYKNSEAEQFLLNFSEKFASENKYSGIILEVPDTEEVTLGKYTGTGFQELGMFSHNYQKTKFKCLQKLV